MPKKINYKNKEIFYKFRVDVYSYTILFSYNQTNDDFFNNVNDYYKNIGLAKIKNDSDINIVKKDDCSGLTLFLSHNTIAIRLFNHTCKNMDYLMDTIAHESLHATLKILDDLGVVYDTNADEAYCYLLGFIVNKIVGKLMMDKD